MEIKEAIKIINQYDMNFHWNDGEPIPAEQLAEAFDLAISALEKQEAEQDRWIPITERMPEENDFVLVTVSGEDVLGLRRRDWKDSMALAVWTNQWNLVDANLVSYRISAWRPLPELYTEDEA